jgi:glycosyltransferase involved in cell wall biosynthesis
VVPGGVDPPGGMRIIPFVHDLVRRLAAVHDVSVLAVGHDPSPGTWRLFDAEVVNIPVGAHAKGDIARVLLDARRHAERGGRPDVVHALWANLPGLTAATVGRRLGAHVVVSVGGGELAALPHIGYGGGLGRGTRTLALASLRLAHAVTVATDWMRHHVTVAGARVDEVIPLGVDTALFRPDTTFDPDHLVHVGSLNRVKDQDLLLRGLAVCLQRAPQTRLTIVGADTLGGHHERLVAELGIADRVTFTGWLPPADVAAVLRTAAWHVLTSHHDAGPLAVMEAAACGVPTVGTPVGHVADWASRSTPAAITIDRRSPEGVADALARAMQPGVRERTAAPALAWARAHDADATVAAFDHLYRRLAANSSSRPAAASGSGPRRST